MNTRNRWILGGALCMSLLGSALALVPSPANAGPKVRIRLGGSYRSCEDAWSCVPKPRWCCRHHCFDYCWRIGCFDWPIVQTRRHHDCDDDD